MKKIITIMMAVAVILFGGMTMEAKTAKKKSKGSTSKIIGKGRLTDNEEFSSISLLANGKVKTNSKCLTGDYEKKDGGKYYIVWLVTSCGDGGIILLLTDNDIYFIDSGSEGYEIWDFIYYPDKQYIHVLLHSSINESEWFENNAYRGFTSLDIPLSKFSKIGTFNLIK